MKHEPKEKRTKGDRNSESTNKEKKIKYVFNKDEKELKRRKSDEEKQETSIAGRGKKEKRNQRKQKKSEPDAIAVVHTSDDGKKKDKGKRKNHDEAQYPAKNEKGDSTKEHPVEIETDSGLKSQTINKFDKILGQRSEFSKNKQLLRDNDEDDDNHGVAHIKFYHKKSKESLDQIDVLPPSVDVDFGEGGQSAWDD